MRQISYKGLVRKLDTVFSRYIRMRDRVGPGVCRCCTCGEVKADLNNQIHCGHFQKRQNFNTRWDERNAAAQCHACNTFKGGREFEMARYIDKRWGDGTADTLYVLAHMKQGPGKKEWNRIALEEQIKVFEGKLETVRNV